MDILDIRDLIESYESQLETNNDRDEFQEIHELLESLKGCGGDYQWRGDWYPLTLINDDNMEEYAQELADDIGAINKDAVWPCNCIDWKEATRELKVDYNTVKYNGETYWYR